MRRRPGLSELSAVRCSRPASNQSGPRRSEYARSRFFLTEAGGLRAERSAPRHTRSFGQLRLTAQDSTVIATVVPAGNDGAGSLKGGASWRLIQVKRRKRPGLSCAHCHHHPCDEGAQDPQMFSLRQDNFRHLSERAIGLGPRAILVGDMFPTHCAAATLEQKGLACT
jgi:hypothetical protein